MKCRYCRVWNSDDEEYCVSCYRPLRMSLSEAPLARAPIVRGAAAPALSSSAHPRVQEAPPEEADANATRRRPLIQGRLPLGDFQQVIPFPMLETAKFSRRKSQAPSATRKRAQKQQKDSRQWELDFMAAAPPPRGRVLESAEEAVVCCDSPVAPRTLRLVSVFIDAAIVCCYLAVFVITVYLAGGSFEYGSWSALAALGAAPLLLGIFYKLLYCLGDGESLGCQVARLRLLTFEGKRPSRGQRVGRLAGALLGALAGGIGLMWALGDEETLSWHDHMSGTFPTTN